MPYTVEELQSRAEQGAQQIEQGQFLTADECAQRRQQLMQQY